MLRWECEQYTHVVNTGSREPAGSASWREGRLLHLSRLMAQHPHLHPCSRSSPLCSLHTPGHVPILALSGMPAPPSTPGLLSFYTQLRHHLPPGGFYGLCRPSDPCVDPICIFTFLPNSHPGSSQAQGVCHFLHPQSLVPSLAQDP